MFAIAPTNTDWFYFLKNSGLNSYVNFWTPTPWNPRSFHLGDRLYFMLTSGIRKIGGFGEFVKYENLAASIAWNKYGYRNGRASRDEFISKIQELIDKNSKKFGGQSININSYEVGNIILKNCQFWDDTDFLDPIDFDIDFADNITTFKYYDKYDPFSQENDTNNFQIISEPRDEDYGQSKTREGQSDFKGKILKAYNNLCCMTSEKIPELLEAAHIQEYRNRDSNHVQNGLLLRVDFHRLFDNDLLFIDRDYKVHISSLITNEYYRAFDSKTIRLPTSVYDYPSKEALELRRSDFRR